MNIYKNNEETGNTPTWRLSKEDIYNDIYLLVKEQVDEMLTRDGSIANWSNATNYTNDMLEYIPNNGWLFSLYDKDEDQFSKYTHNWVGNGITQDVAVQMIANYPRYLSIYWKNYKKMIKQAGLTRDVYLQRKWVIEEEIRVKAQAKADSWVSKEKKEMDPALAAEFAALFGT